MRLLLLLCITGSLVMAKMSLAVAREDEDPNWIVDVVDPKCSKPCGGGVRTVTYKCAVYKHSSGETFTVPDKRCKAVIKPPTLKPCNQEKCFFKVTPVQSIAGVPHTWKSTNKWTKCMNGCFGGTRCMINKCWHLPSKAWVPDSKCAGLDEPRKLCQTCTEYVSCPPKWRKSDWSVCSRTCGSGVRTREVSCAAQLGANHFTDVDSSKCQKLEKPHTSERCAKVDCPAEFVASKWGPCKNANSANCGLGERRRKVACVKVLASGVPKKIGYRACVRRFGIKGFPPTWNTCVDYSVKMSDNCKRKRKGTVPKITVDNTTVIQMKRARKIRLQVGETVYVFPSTTLIIKCPVKDFDPRDLTWTHEDNMVNTASKRIQMNYRGRLKIRYTRQRDEGKWRCIAGPANASIAIHMRYPSDGFREYAIRQPLLSKIGRDLHSSMLSDAAGRRKKKKYSGRTKRAVQWVSGSWSKCSRSCGGPGVMKRTVQCERVRDKYYKVYPDANCVKQGLRKPPTVKDCGGFNVCPMWQVESDRGKCTNQCLRPGFALQKDRIFCGMNNQRLPLNFCNQERKPMGVAECVNSECQLTWKVSKWSNCSRTCGGLGVMARHLQCVWQNTQAHAGYSCFKHNIKQPVAFKTCETPKCVLDCIDLTPQCMTIKPGLCRYKPYQRYCCKRCQTFAKLQKKKMMKKKKI